MRILALALLLLCKGLPAAAAAAAAGPAAPKPAAEAGVKERLSGAKKDLVRIQREIRQAEAKVREHERQESAISTSLSDLNRRLEVARRDAVVHGRNLALVEDKLSQIHARLDVLEQEAGADRVSLGHSLERLYRSRVSRGPLMLLSAKSPGELGARVRYLATLTRSIHRRMRGLKERIAEVDGIRREVHEREVELQRRRSAAETARRRVASESQLKQSQLRAVRSKKAHEEAMLKARLGSELRLQDMMDGLQREAERQAEARAEAQAKARRRRTGGGSVIRVLGPSSVRGRLPWPVSGRLLSRFGKQRHPLFNTPVFNRGIEIASPHGSPVKAVAKGVVVYAGEMEGFGNLVVVDHGGKTMSVYGYASQLHVAAGQPVAQGAVLADVGEGSTSGQPSLYFEIRKGAKALDPLAFLGRR